MLKIGHRGASAAAPENTLTAFRMAIAKGADGVELDVHRCKSGELVVIHDDTVDRTTDGAGRVADMRFEQLMKLRIAGTERIALLEEALMVLAGKHCFIEIKHPDAALAAAELVNRHIAAGGQADRLWLISFRHEALTRVKEEYPLLNIGASFEVLEPSSILGAHAFGAHAIIPHHQPVGEKQVGEAHALGLKVFCWTVNEPADIARLKAAGVDGIMSDYPERL